MRVERRPKIEDSGKGRLRSARVLILFLVGATILAGCGHIRVSVEITAPEPKATETVIAASVVVTPTGAGASPTHRQLAALSQQAHEATAAGHTQRRCRKSRRR